METLPKKRGRRKIPKSEQALAIEREKLAAFELFQREVIQPKRQIEKDEARRKAEAEYSRYDGVLMSRGRIRWQARSAEEMTELARRMGDAAICFYYEVLKDKEAKISDRMKAADVILDRGYGKAYQKVGDGNESSKPPTISISIHKGEERKGKEVDGVEVLPASDGSEGKIRLDLKI